MRRADSLLGLAAVASLGLAAASPAAASVCLVALTAFYLITRGFAPPHLRPTLVGLFATALTVRVALAAVLQWVVPATPIGQQLRAADPLLAERTAHLGFTLFWDEQAYEHVAWSIAEWWRTAPDLIRNGRIEWLNPTLYLQSAGSAWGIYAKEAELYILPHTYLVAAVYTLLGREPLVARTTQSVVAATVPVLIFLLARTWFGTRVGRAAGWLAVVEPSLVFWSPWVLKDESAAALLLASLLSVTRVAARGARLSSLTALVLSLGVLIPVRAPVAIYLALLQPLGALMANRARAHRPTLAALLFLMGCSVLWFGGQGFMGARRLNVDLPFQLWYARVTFGEGARTAIAEAPGGPTASAAPQGQPAANPDELRSVNAFPRVPLWATLESLQRHVTYLPRAVVTVVAAPAPWSVDAAQDRVGLALLPTWYATLMLGVWGLVRGWRYRKRFLALPAAYLLITLVYVALADSAIGILLRHRLMLLPVLLPLAVYGARYVPLPRWLPSTLARPSLRPRRDSVS